MEVQVKNLSVCGSWITQLDGILTYNGSSLLLEVEIPADIMIGYQWGEERQHHWITGTGSHEFLVPGSAVNYYGRPVVEDVDRLSGLLDNIDLSGI